MPDMPSFPVSAFIPFSLDIETVTKRMKLKDTPKREAIFPAPPRHPREIEIVLRTQIAIRATGYNETWHQTKCFPCNLYGNIRAIETPQTERSNNLKDPHIPGREWIAFSGQNEGSEGKGQVGSWRQHVIYQSKFSLDCPPTFKSKNVDVSVRTNFFPFANVTRSCSTN